MDNDDSVTEVYVIGKGRVTPFNTITKNLRVKKKDMVSDKDIMEELDAYYLHLSKRDHCVNSFNLAAERK